MSFIKWFLVAWFVLGALSTVLTVGKPRKPVSPEMAAGAVFGVAVMITLVVFA